jgi:hypothetical protein
MLSISIGLGKWIGQPLPATPIPGSIRGPCQHHKDTFKALETIFTTLFLTLKVAGFIERLSQKANIHRSTLSTWRIKIARDLAWRPMRCHYAWHREFLVMIKRLSWQHELRREH